MQSDLNRRIEGIVRLLRQKTRQRAIYTTKRSLRDLSNKVTSDERTRIIAIIERLRETIKSEYARKMRAEMEELTRAFYDISMRAYQQAGARYQQEKRSRKKKVPGTGMRNTR